MRINKAFMFVTTWMGILTISTGELIYVDAGHEYPAICRSGEEFEIVKDVHGIPMAATSQAQFTSGTISLERGDTIFLYTDGVPEANNASGEMFGTQRLLRALNSDPGAAPEVIDRNVHEELAAFVQNAPQFDDITMLTFRYFGSAE
jgi:sigma-B regulation protein RsbU (phosphoserine phosphatase)